MHVNAENGNSTVCTNGDREFRAIIYDDATFEGVAFSQDENDYTYFQKFWDNVFFTNTVDISKSTAEEPAGGYDIEFGSNFFDNVVFEINNCK